MAEQVDVNRIIEIENIPAIRIGEIVKLKSEGTALVEQLRTLAAKPIKNQGECDAINLGIGKLKKIVKFIDDCRKSAGKPLRDALDQINSKVKVAVDPINEVITTAAATVRVWDDEQERLHREAEEKARKEEDRRRKISLAQGGKGEVATPVPQPAPLAMTRSTTYRKHWDYEVVDLSKVPVDYIVINGPKVRDAMMKSRDKDGKPTIDIPGIRFFQEKTRVG